MLTYAHVCTPAAMLAMALGVKVLARAPNTMSDMRLKSAPSFMRAPARLSGAQITCCSSVAAVACSVAVVGRRLPYSQVLRLLALLVQKYKCDMRLTSAPSSRRAPEHAHCCSSVAAVDGRLARLSGTQITCFTGTRVQILILDAGALASLCLG
jgi:hypothetical protein